MSRADEKWDNFYNSAVFFANEDSKLGDAAGDFAIRIYNAVYRALKRAGDSGKTQAGRYAAKHYNIKKSDFMRNVKTDLSWSESNSNDKRAYDRLSGLRLDFAGFVLTLPLYNIRKVAKDAYKVNVLKGGTGGVIEKAFTRTFNGHFGIYKRDSNKKLKQLYGPSTAHMMQNPEVIEMLMNHIREVYEKRADHEVNRVLNGFDLTNFTRNKTMWH